MSRHAGRVSAGLLVLTVLFGTYAVRNLGINSDNLSLVSDDLPSRIAHRRFVEHFPNLEEALFIVVDARTPELARAASEVLTERLAAETDYFTDAYLPGGGEFFERNGLMYRSPQELDYFADQMARIQPLVAELERDPSLAKVAEIVRLGLDELEQDGEGLEQWRALLDQLSRATVAIFDEYPLSISWEELLLADSSLAVDSRRAIVAHPILDYSDILTGRRPIGRIREICRELGYLPEQGVRVRITGNPALNYDEMIGLAWDIGGASVFCFALVALVLLRALRAWQLVAAALVTLLVGLIWTAAFAALAVGALNVLSISFAILFIGLGVDFAIHLGIGYAAARRAGADHDAAIETAAGEVGGALALCTMTTAIGFYVFVPTEYRGVAELGVIAGSGMFIIFFLTLTLFPALIGGWLRIRDGGLEDASLSLPGGWWDVGRRHPATVRWLALAAAIAAVSLLPRARIDMNVVEMRDPTTESVLAFQDLLSRSETSPWYLNDIEPDERSAEAVRARLEELESVKYAVTLASYIPEDQDEKIEILGDIGMLFEPPHGLTVHDDAEDADAAAQLEALARLRDFLGEAPLAGRASPVGDSMRRLRADIGTLLERVEREGNAETRLAELERVLLAPLPAQLKRLRKALAAEPIELEDLPRQLVERMQTSDGMARVQIFPSRDLRELDDFVQFVTEVKAIAPNASGVPVNLVEFGQVTARSFQQALISAVVLISVLLLSLWRRPADVLLVMTPLLLGASLTGATMAALDIRFDFTNVVVIPLLLGIGVDSAIHLVQRVRDGDADAAASLATSSTARAIFYSAVTTLVSFGSLSFAGHNGMKSLGYTLSFGLAYTLLCVLVVLPALLDLDARKAASASSRTAGPSAD